MTSASLAGPGLVTWAQRSAYSSSSAGSSSRLASMLRSYVVVVQVSSPVTATSPWSSTLVGSPYPSKVLSARVTRQPPAASLSASQVTAVPVWRAYTVVSPMSRLAVAADCHGWYTVVDTGADSTPLYTVDWRTLPPYASSSATAGASAVPAVLPSPLRSRAGRLTARVPPAPLRSPFMPWK